MTQRFLTHISTALLLHMAILFGGLTIMGNEVMEKNLGQRILNLKVASEVIFAAPKNVTRTVAPTRKNAPVLERKSAPVAPVQEEATVTDPVAQEGGVNGVRGGSVDGTPTTDPKLIYKAELRALIDENKFYPPVARRLQQTGTAIVKFSLLSDGSITDIKLDRSSGNDRLDDAAITAVKKVKKFRKIPSEFATNKLDMSVPIKFSTI